MGLNDVYDQVRSQILLQDSLSTVNKAFSKVLRVESQKEVQMNFFEHTEATTLTIRTQGDCKESRRYNPNRGRCDYCNRDGHTKVGCFKLIGYPEWFKARNKSIVNQGPSQQKYTAYASQSQGHNAKETLLAYETPSLTNELSKYDKVNAKLKSLQ